MATTEQQLDAQAGQAQILRRANDQVRCGKAYPAQEERNPAARRNRRHQVNHPSLHSRIPHPTGTKPRIYVSHISIFPHIYILARVRLASGP